MIAHLRWLLILLGWLSFLFAEGDYQAVLEGADEVQAWKLAKIKAIVKNNKGEESPPEKLRWKLLLQGKDQSQELFTSETSKIHENSFRPKKTESFTVQIFLEGQEKPLAEKNVNVSTYSGILKDLATKGSCSQELGFVDWVEDLKTAQALATEKQTLILLAYFTG
ncbi:MAG: hypothetical protein AABZ60_21275 [Planctomycetota bacterium]